MQPKVFAYPFDPNGTAPSNKVVGERHTISPINGPDFRFIVPKAAPFFRTGLVVSHPATNRILREGTDYQLGHRYDAATNTAPYLSVFGSILIMDSLLEGTLQLEYQTLGGEHTVDEQTLLELLANTQLDPRVTKWDSVLNKPTTFNPLLHRQNISNFMGFDDAVTALNRLTDAVIAKMQTPAVDAVARQHIADLNNPHQVKLSQLSDGSHLLNLTPEYVTVIVNAINGGGGLGGGGGSWTSVNPGPLSANTRVVPNNASPNGVFVLPENPTNLTWVEWIAGPTPFATNPIRFRSADKIGGAVGDVIVNTTGDCGLLVWFESLQSWMVYHTGVGAGGSLGGGGGGIGAEADPIAIEMLRWKPFSGGAIPSRSRIIPNNATALAGTLATAPTDGEWVEWRAGHIPFSQFPFTISSTKKISGSTEPLVIDTDGSCGLLVFSAAADSWLVYHTGIGVGGSFPGGSGGASLSPKTAATQLRDGDYFVPNNATGPAIHDAPTNPKNLAAIEWVEGPMSFAVNKLVIRNTDKPIMGLAEPLEVTTQGSGGKLIYFESLGYWKLYLSTQAGSISGANNGGGSVIAKAAITSPTNNQSGVQSNFSLTSTTFSTTPALADTLVRYEWQIAADVGFQNLFWSGNSQTNQATPTVSIPNGTTVFVRVRFVGATYGAGSWSDVVTFTVAAVAGPTSVSIAGSTLPSGGITHQFTINSSAWSGGGTHAASQFRVLTTAGTVVYDSGELPGAIVSHKPFDNNFRPSNLTDYTAQVRYKLATGQWTNYTTANLKTANAAITTVGTSYQTSWWSYWTYMGVTSYYDPNGSNNPFGGSGPYRICYAGDFNSGETSWKCDPSDPMAGAAAAGYEPGMGPVMVGLNDYPRTAFNTQRVTSYLRSYNTSRNTQTWTEW